MKFNNRERLDLTEWIIHFIHDRKPEDDISSLADTDGWLGRSAGYRADAQRHPGGNGGTERCQKRRMAGC